MAYDELAAVPRTASAADEARSSKNSLAVPSKRDRRWFIAFDIALFSDRYRDPQVLIFIGSSGNRVGKKSDKNA